jgi:predicted RNase H-like HicB family nuclease
MKIKVVVHEAEEGGYWGEVPSLPGCASQGETVEELLVNLREAIGGYLAEEPPDIDRSHGDRIVELAL